MHAYVGDEVIVSWPVSDDPARNGRCVGCFLAIERKIARLEGAYEAEFELAPKFRAGLHAGPVIVSECGDVKRQLAYFGDTMNVAARLCEYCKAIDRRLVVSGDALRLMSDRAQSRDRRRQEHRGARPAGAGRSPCDRTANMMTRKLAEFNRRRAGAGTGPFAYSPNNPAVAARERAPHRRAARSGSASSAPAPRGPNRSRARAERRGDI